jgi:hypothetical protein
MPPAPIHHEGKPLDDKEPRGVGGEAASVGGPGNVGCTGTNSRPRCPNRSSRCRCELGRSTSPRTSPCNVACHTRAAPTPSCTAGCWPNSHTPAARRPTSTSPRTSRTKRSAPWLSGPTRCFTARGQRWDHRGQRTIAWRSRPRSWSPDLARSCCAQLVVPPGGPRRVTNVPVDHRTGDRVRAGQEHVRVSWPRLGRVMLAARRHKSLCPSAWQAPMI